MLLLSTLSQYNTIKWCKGRFRPMLAFWNWQIFFLRHESSLSEDVCKHNALSLLKCAYLPLQSRRHGRLLIATYVKRSVCHELAAVKISNRDSKFRISICTARRIAQGMQLNQGGLVYLYLLELNWSPTIIIPLTQIIIRRLANLLNIQEYTKEHFKSTTNVKMPTTRRF